MTNLVDMLRAFFPRRVECATCGVALQFRNLAWRDGAGSDLCATNTAHVTPSPMLAGYGRETR